MDTLSHKSERALLQDICAGISCSSEARCTLFTKMIS